MSSSNGMVDGNINGSHEDDIFDSICPECELFDFWKDSSSSET